VQHLLTGIYGTLRIEPHGPQHGARIAQTPLGPARLDNMRFAMDFDAQGDPPGMLYVGHLLSGALTVGTGHDRRAYQPGDVLLAAQPDNPYTATIRGTSIDPAGIPPDLLAQVADTGPDRKQQPLSLTGPEPVSGKAAASWKATYAYTRQLAQDPATAGQPLVAASAARLLAAVTLATFPSNALTEPTAADRHDASPATLRRAVAFIDGHARQDITVADIAASALSPSAPCNSPSGGTWTPPRRPTCARSDSTTPTTTSPPPTPPWKPSQRSPSAGASLARAGSPPPTTGNTALPLASPSTTTSAANDRRPPRAWIVRARNLQGQRKQGPMAPALPTDHRR
jgi:hypothetical protein